MINPVNSHAYTRPVFLWLDLLLFKASWIALVLFQNSGVFPALALGGLKMVFWPSTPRMLLVTALVLVAGISLDLALAGLGVFIFENTLMPAWLVILWLVFALTMPRSFAGIGKLHPLVQSACGMLAGLVGYMAGYLAGAVAFGYSLAFTACVIGLCWALLVPLLFLLEQNLAES